MVTMPQRRSPGPFPYRRLGQRIADLRERAGMSQERLASLVGISKGYPGRIETGRNRPDALILRRIALVLGADYQELAALAGYLDPPQGDTAVMVPSEKAGRVERIAQFTSRQLDRLLDVAHVMFLEETPQEDAGQERERQGQNNDSQAEAQSPG